MRYFTLAEFEWSDKAAKNGINNRIPKSAVPNIERLVETLLDPTRSIYGKPITVTSGYRCPQLNKLVGGSKTSDHQTGCAADIIGKPNTPKENRILFDLIKNIGFDFDQLIYEERHTKNGVSSWVHVSVRENNREQSWENII